MSKRQPGQPVRVLIVEDSRAQRELLINLLRASEQFEVAGIATNGQEAVEETRRLRPDVIAMDIHMPIVDGYEATRQIMQCCPTPIVMVSNSMGDEGRRSVQALAAGALAVLRKPGNVSHQDFEADRQNMLRTLRLMADVPVVTRHAMRPPRPDEHPTVKKPHMTVVAIAASTGGPAAVQTVLMGLGKDFPLPILLVQHIAQGFGAALADWLNTTIPLQVRIAQENEKMLPGHVYLAPDEHHLLASAMGTIGLRRAMNFDRYCPCADILFDSVARGYGNRAIGVILTGMGDDGAQGLRAIRTQGGYTVGQDEASCVVYGMPQAAAANGAIIQVEPLARISQAILDKVISSDTR
jgi:two-component system, chemotaxis family, protein-glutamate methylesterase/glutaminase